MSREKDRSNCHLNLIGSVIETWQDIPDMIVVSSGLPLGPRETFVEAKLMREIRAMQRCHSIDHSGGFARRRCSRSFGEEIPRESQVAGFNDEKPICKTLECCTEWGLTKLFWMQWPRKTPSESESDLFFWKASNTNRFQRFKLQMFGSLNAWTFIPQQKVVRSSKQIFLTSPSWGPTWCLLPEATSEVPRLLNALRQPTNQ